MKANLKIRLEKIRTERKAKLTATKKARVEASARMSIKILTEALARVRASSPDLMLLDYKMPGMNGFQVFTQARALRPDMAFLLATAHATPEIIQEARQMGFSSILLKPFSSAELRAAVEKALAEKV